MVLALGALLLLAVIFGPSLWVKLVMRRYSSEKPKMQGTGGGARKAFDREVFFRRCAS